MQLKETKDLKDKRIRLILLGRMLEVSHIVRSATTLRAEIVPHSSAGVCLRALECTGFDECTLPGPTRGNGFILALLARRLFRALLHLCAPAVLMIHNCPQDSHTLSSYGMKDGDFVHAAISEEVYIAMMYAQFRRSSSLPEILKWMYNLTREMGNYGSFRLHRRTTLQST